MQTMLTKINNKNPKSVFECSLGDIHNLIFFFFLDPDSFGM